MNRNQKGLSWCTVTLQLNCARTVLVLASLACSSSNVSEPTEAFDEALRWADIGQECPESAPVALLSQERRDSLPANVLGPVGTPNRDWADAARTIPGGIGGVLMEDEIFYLYLVDPSKRAEAIAGLSALSIGRGLPLADAQVRQGRWDFAQLGDWYGYLALKGAFGQGIVSADIQEARNRLEYGVPSESDRRSFEQWLTLLGVPCHLVAIGLEQPFVPLSH